MLNAFDKRKAISGVTEPISLLILESVFLDTLGRLVIPRKFLTLRVNKRGRKRFGKALLIKSAVFITRGLQTHK